MAVSIGLTNSLKRSKFLLSMVWSFIILFFLLWHCYGIYRHTKEIVSIQLSAAYEKDMTFRAWAASHGGLYVLVTDETQPNPNLSDIKERDVETPSGRNLTLMNPAYILRQAYETAEIEKGFSSHLTSLNPLRPGNRADAWEIEALSAFERGESEVSGQSIVDGIKVSRMMRPFITEESCLKCHSGQGYKVGDIRGGISVSVPIVPFWSAMSNQIAQLVGGYVFIIFLGIGGIFFGLSVLEERMNERDLAQSALKYSEDRFHSLFENVPIGYQSLDKDGNFLEVNQSWLDMLGYEREEVIGRNFSEFLPMINVERFKDAFLGFLAAGKIDGIEHTLVCKDGKEKVVAYNGKTGCNPDGSFRQTYCVFHDITKRKKAETERVKMQEQLQHTQKVDSIGRLAGGVAHDLNNLLCPIIGYCEILSEDLIDNSLAGESIDEILSAASRARDLVRQLLAFGRKQTLEYKTVDLNKALENFGKLLRKAIREDIEIEFSFSPHLKFIEADIGQLEQVFMNLAINGQDAMADGGTLVFKTSICGGDGSCKCPLEWIDSGVGVVLSVSDDGCGMDAEILEHLFEPFYSTKGDCGTGLGLATVYGIVKQHRGHVTVSSTPDSGTTVSIYLPASAGKEEIVSSGLKDVLPSKEGTGTILLVEDNERVRTLATKILVRHKYTLLVAEDGPEALKLLKNHNGVVDLLLTDVVMPGMNGKKLYDKAIETHPELKVLYMSGYSGDVIAHRGILDEGVAFIHKPFEIESFLTTIRSALDG